MEGELASATETLNHCVSAPCLVVTGQLCVTFRLADQIQAAVLTLPLARIQVTAKYSFSARIDHKCHMALCRQTSPDKEWNSNMYHTRSSEERQSVDPALSLSPSRHHTDSARSGLLPHQRFNQMQQYVLQTFQNIPQPLSLLESGRKLSDDHLRLSAGFPL